jgi:hypothetical protein
MASTLRVRFFTSASKRPNSRIYLAHAAISVMVMDETDTPPNTRADVFWSPLK